MCALSSTKIRGDGLAVWHIYFEVAHFLRIPMECIIHNGLDVA